MTTQYSHSFAFSPTGLLHEVTIRFKGNNVTARTKCGIIVNIKTWQRVLDEHSHSIRADVRCTTCFK